MPSPGTVDGLLTHHTFNGKKRRMMCPRNELQLTSAQRRKSQGLSEEASALASEHRQFAAAAPSRSGRKSPVNCHFGGELRAAGSLLRFVSMRDLQVKRLKSEDQWRQS